MSICGIGDLISIVGSYLNVSILRISINAKYGISLQ
jgi:hypothetical protein